MSIVSTLGLLFDLNFGFRIFDLLLFVLILAQLKSFHIENFIISFLSLIVGFAHGFFITSDIFLLWHILGIILASIIIRNWTRSQMEDCLSLLINTLVIVYLTEFIFVLSGVQFKALSFFDLNVRAFYDGYRFVGIFVEPSHGAVILSGLALCLNNLKKLSIYQLVAVLCCLFFIKSFAGYVLGGYLVLRWFGLRYTLWLAVMAILIIFLDLQQSYLFSYQRLDAIVSLKDASFNHRFGFLWGEFNFDLGLIIGGANAGVGVYVFKFIFWNGVVASVLIVLALRYFLLVPFRSIISVLGPVLFAFGSLGSLMIFWILMASLSMKFAVIGRSDVVGKS